MIRSAAALLFLVACGDNAPRHVSAAPFSGSRLHLIAESWTGGLTRVRPDALFDTDRNETCIPTAWSDGRRYCSPPTTAPIAYTDAACTHPVALWSTFSAFPTPTYFRKQFFGAGAATTSRLYQRGPRMDPPSEIWEAGPTGCTPLPGPTDITAYTATELASDTFELVALLPVESDVHQRIVRYAYESEDGMQLLEPSTRYDSTLGESCAFISLPGELQSTCTPATTELTYYTDERCTTPLVDVTSGVPSGLFSYIDPETACPRFGSLGEPLEVTSLFNRRFDGKCLLAVSDPITNAAAVKPIQVATADRNHIDEAHRLQRIERSETDAVTEVRMYDTMLDAECARGTMPDGDFCIPISSPYNAPGDATFTDENCRTRIDLALVSEPLCGDPPKFYVTLDVHGTPVIRPITPFSAPVYRTTTAEQCQLFTPDAAIYRVGDPLPSAMLARVTDNPL